MCNYRRDFIVVWRGRKAQLTDCSNCGAFIVNIFHANSSDYVCGNSLKANTFSLWRVLNTWTRDSRRFFRPTRELAFVVCKLEVVFESKDKFFFLPFSPFRKNSVYLPISSHIGVDPSNCKSILVFKIFLARVTSNSVTLEHILILLK
jgi:hypothetical protein